jgi:hypothetical protein
MAKVIFGFFLGLIFSSSILLGIFVSPEFFIGTFFSSVIIVMFLINYIVNNWEED